MRTLAIETSGDACSIALLDTHTILAERHERVGRGHAERLIPWISDLPGGGRADRIIVGCGPGSFTGVRIGIAAARALGLGWAVPVTGVSSLSLLAAACPDEDFVVAKEGGHGELLVQHYHRSPLRAVSDFASLAPDDAGKVMLSPIVVGEGAAHLIAARGYGTYFPAEARAANVRVLPPEAIQLPACPIYGRAPDARPMA